MEIWKLETNKSSDHKQRCPFLKTFEIFKYPLFIVDAFGDFAYDFTEATSRNIESRKDVCFDTYQNYSI